jgi:hypothetical protein
LKNVNWNKIWGTKFIYGPLRDWEKDIFINICGLLKDQKIVRVMSAGCGRGLIDYWLIQVFGFKITLLDNSKNCIKNLQKSFRKVDKAKYELCYASIFEIPYPDNTFDLVWNAGVLEHFQEKDLYLALKEMTRVSSRYLLCSVPNMRSKPYMLAKKFLEENDLWKYGYENPKLSLRKELKNCGLEVKAEFPIGSIQTNWNYVNMVPSESRHLILDQLSDVDFKVFPHIMIIGDKKERNKLFGQSTRNISPSKP